MLQAQQNPQPNPLALPQVGETLDGKYRIDGILGSGGMGIVFAATHLRLARPVAIKMLLPEWMEEPSVVDRFAREGRASAAIRSEHIARVLDVDECDGRPYLVLEYLEGESFDALLATSGTLPVTRAVDVVLEACEAVAEAHAVGTIHRDLKPANLFLARCADGSQCVKLLDFGISKMARSGRTSTFLTGGTGPLTVMGSPQYMAPEQMRSATDATERSDIWSLGTILHELLAGVPPFAGDTITEVCARVMNDPAPSLTCLRADVPSGLEGVVIRCLEKEPARRYANVADLARALAPFGTDASRTSAEKISRIVEGGISRTPAVGSASSPPTRARVATEDSAPRGIRRPVGGYLLGAMTVLAALGGIGWKIATQSAAIRASEREAPRAEVAVTASHDIPPVPPASSTRVASAVVSTRAAVVAPVASAAPPAPTPAPVHVPAQVHRRVHPKPRPPTPPPVESAPSLIETTPAIAPLVAPPSVPSSSAAAPAPADPDALFDQRK